MTDLITRLRTAGKNLVVVGHTKRSLCAEAADEIECLRGDNAILHKVIAVKDAEIERLRADAERYRWLRDNPTWSVSYRIKPRSGLTEYRMREESEYWGPWWPTHEQAIDHAMEKQQ